MSQKTDAELTTQADVIKDETTAGANTATRIGQMIIDLIDSKPSLAGTYNNPDWINQLGWSKITGEPTTLSGYGITDAVPTSRAVNGHPLSSDVTVTKSDVGLGNVDNTSDANKPVSSAQAAAIALSGDATSNVFNANAAPYSLVPDDAGHDNSGGLADAIQDAFEWSQANGGSVAFVELDNGVYYLTRAVQTTNAAGLSGYYSQVPLPYNAYSTTNGYPGVVIRPKKSNRYYNPTVPMYFNNLEMGVTFRSTLTGQSYSATFGWPSMFGGKDRKQGETFVSHYSLMSIEFQNINFMVPQAPTIAIVNDSLITRVKYDNITACVFKDIPANPVPQPSSPLGVFNFAPAWNNNTLVYSGMNIFLGLYAGPSLGEHTVQEGGKIAISDCVIGCRLAFDGNTQSFFHGIKLSNVSTEGVLYGFAPSDKDGLQVTSGANSSYVSSSGKIQFNIDFWDIETGGGASWNTGGMIFGILDYGNVMQGFLKYTRTTYNVGNILPTNSTYHFGVVGARDMVLTDLGSVQKTQRALAALTDNFNRADNASSVGNLDLPAYLPWTAQAGTWGISSGKAYCASAVSSGAVTTNRLIADCGSATVNYQLTVSRGSSGGIVQGYYRYTDANNHCFFELTGTDLRLYKRVSSTVTQIGSTYSVSTNVGQAYAIRIVASGNGHTVYFNGISRITASDAANNTATIVGIGVLSGTGGSNSTDRFWSVDVDLLSNPYNHNIFSQQIIYAGDLRVRDGAISGTLTVPTQSPSDNSTKVASTAYADAAVALVSGAGGYRSITGADSVTSSDYFKTIVCSGTSADYTVTLPTAVGISGKWFHFVGAVALTKIVTIDPNSTERINGITTRAFTSGGGFTIVSDGSNWQVQQETPSAISYTPTVTNVSSQPATILVTYSLNGKNMSINYYLDPAAPSGTGLGFNIPSGFTCAKLTTVISRVQSGGTYGTGMAQISNSATSIAFFATAAGGAVSGSGNKAAEGVITFPIQ